MVAPTPLVYAQATSGCEISLKPWKTYPFRPPGTEIFFPDDEGSHDTSQFPIEWWYANFHLIGQTTGHEYGSFVAFYHVQSTVAEKQEIRIFSISDLATKKTYTTAQVGTLTASNDHLDLSFKHSSDGYEMSSQNNYAATNTNSFSLNQDANMKTMGTTVDQEMIKSTSQDFQSNSDELLEYDYWYTKSNDQGFLPFQYTLITSGNSQQDYQTMELVVDMNCLKQPLIVGGDGVINFENREYSFYYSLTKIDISGIIIVHGIKEQVVGQGWIDHQWGNFINQNPPPLGLTITYEWFSIKFDDNQEIMVGDAWDRKTGKKLDLSFTGGLNLVKSDGSSELLDNYKITTLKLWNDSIDKRFFSSKWHITETSKSIDLTIDPIYPDQVIRAKEDYPLFQQFLEKLLPGACFWNGVCTVTGTINGIPVNGKAYVELTHCYNSCR